MLGEPGLSGSKDKGGSGLKVGWIKYFLFFGIIYSFEILLVILWRGVESGLARAKKEIVAPPSEYGKSINFPQHSLLFWWIHRQPKSEGRDSKRDPNQREEIRREIQKEMKRASQSREHVRRSQPLHNNLFLSKSHN